jgi:CubicO group peptidase (beta-lactamase class C family)
MDDTTSAREKRAGSYSPESLGVSSRGIIRFLDRLQEEGQEHHAFQLRRRGQVVVQGAWAPYRLDARHRAFSVSKSLTSLAVGLLVGDGRLSLDDRAVEILSGAVDATEDEYLLGLSVRDLLMMATGQPEDPIFTLGASANWVRRFFQEPCAEHPGRIFRYNSTASHILAAIVQAVSGRKTVELLQDRVLGPLGLGPVPTELSPSGIPAGGWGCHLLVEEMAVLGELILEGGIWRGRRLLPEAYLREATAFQIDTTESFGRGFGYHFWLCPDGGWRMDGAFGQACLAMPDRGAVFAATSGLHDHPRFFRSIWELREGMTEGTLPEDPEARAELDSRLAGLKFRLEGAAATSPLESLVSNRRYRLPPNDYGYHTVMLTFDSQETKLRLETDRGIFEAAAGRNGEYRRTSPGWEKVLLPWLAFGALPSVPEFVPEVFAASRWNSPSSFNFSIRISDSPSREDWTFEFAEGGRTCRVTQRPGAIMEFKVRAPLEGLSDN